MADTSMEEKIDQLYILQAERMKAIKNTLANFRMDSGKPSVKKTRAYFDIRLDKIKTIYDEFQCDHKVLLFNADSSSDYFVNEASSKFEEAYLEVYCALIDEKENVIGAPSTSNSSNNGSAPTNRQPFHYASSVQAPNIPITPFSGRIVDWLPFYDSYVRLIHANLSLDPMQKFYMLKQALPQDKDLDIQHMDLTEENYNSAWSLLQKRYENPRVIFMALMNSLYGLEVQSTESSSQLKTLLNAAHVFINGLKRWKIPIDSCDHWLAHFLSSKLPKETHQAWERDQGATTEIATFSKFEKFLNAHIISLDAIENRNVGNPLNRNRSEQSKSQSNNFNNANDKRSSHKSFKTDNKKSVHALTKNSNSKSYDVCAGCGNNSHPLRTCKSFLAKDCFARKSIAEKAKLCYNCLSKSHTVSQCNSKFNCGICGARHNTLLHFPVDAPSGPTNAITSAHSSVVASASNTTQNPQQTVNAHSTRLISTASIAKPPDVLLATALVKMVHPSTGREIMVRAFFDGGSEGTAVSEQIVQSLGLTRKPLHTNITGVGDSKQSSSEVTDFILRSYTEPDFGVFIDSALILRIVTAPLPTKRIVPQAWAHIHGLNLADPTYFQPGKIDLLIGTEMAAAILLPQIKIGLPHEPIAQNTHFGWMLSGQTGQQSSIHHIRCHHTTFQSNELDSLVRGFFDCDNVREERSLSEEEQWVVDHFKSTHIRKENGRYQVRLPLKSIFDPTLTLGKSQQLALNRFRQLERKLHRNSELKARYSNVIKEYFDLNQIKRAFSTEEQHSMSNSSNMHNSTSCVLPHHAVIREDSLTTKLRVVFDASAKTTNGRSLNDLLCIGPPLQNDMCGVLINWRTHRYVFTSDIEKMYRCIDMHPGDAQYQRIWWYDENNEPQLFILTTVTFGTASAPCAAILVMRQIAEDEKERFPLAESVLKHEIYVDDIQTGAHTVEHALKIRDQVIEALKSAGMNLRKWASNDIRILDGIPVEHQSNSQSLTLHNQDSIKILGMCWIPNNDCFKFQLKFELPTEITKRSILSTIARLYDPLGYLAPIVIAAKIILKEVWATTNAADWDKLLSTEIVARWQRFASDLPSIDKIIVPRWINYTPGTVKSIQLHVFCDGSTSAYAAAAYIRIQYHTGDIHTHLIAAKSKVTPTKPLTIPKIELNGAELAVRLASWITSQFRIKIDCTYFWSDATIVLYWIHGDVNRWKTYVANRIVKILNASKSDQWSHVGTKDNPADCATRGLSPVQLQTFDLWWKGPQWLAQSESNWPKFNVNASEVDEASAEIKPAKVHIHFNIPTESIVFKYSSLQRLIRVAAWINRFKYNSLAKRNEHSKRKGPLLVSETHHSLLQVVRLVQQEAFGPELTFIASNEPLPKRCKIKGLAPFIENNLLRVRGRLQRSNLSYQQKHPLILPSSHHLTKLIIEDSHLRTLHGGAQLVLTHTRQKFWIVDGRRTIQLQLRKCVTCFKRKPECESQLMGNLPYHRVNPPQFPFAATGIDYTGAFEVKASRFRGNTTYKAYIAIFICLATKAVHLEVVTGMSTKHFLWALIRFVGRRGKVRDIYSDNGTNFVGAEKELKKCSIPFVEGVESDVIPELSKENIQWHFNPPHSPNFGGLWEANIRSMKYHLVRVLDNSHLTYEELSTVLVRIESMMNSRPLCPLTMDPDDLNVLTPGHFLVLRPMLSVPDAPDLTVALSENHIVMQQMMQQFWSRWSSDWLSHLQQRPKWHNVQPNLQINDIVIIKDDRLKPKEWLIGRIIDIHPGADNLVRVATVRTSKGIYKRSVSKLCRLPIPNDPNINNNSSSRNETSQTLTL